MLGAFALILGGSALATRKGQRQPAAATEQADPAGLLLAGEPHAPASPAGQPSRA
jgi:hypothetical protein